MEDKVKPMEEVLFPSALSYLLSALGHWKLVDENYETSIG
jgi:hypothetical protein